MNHLQNSLYHKFLRSGAAVVAAVLMFQSGVFVDSTADLARNTHLFLAQSVGMSASVQPTDLNQVTAELTKQQQLLDAREAEINEREIAIGLAAQRSSSDRTTFLIAALLFILLVLIVLNYVLDFLRGRPIAALEQTQQTV